MAKQTLNANLLRPGFKMMLIGLRSQTESILLKTRFKNSTTNDWLLDINMDQCGITPTASNDSISFPLKIQTEASGKKISPPMFHN